MKQHWHYRSAQTEGRTWDGNLYVYNHSVPRAWLVTMVFAVAGALIYWLLYPSWPGTSHHYPGIIELELHGSEGDVRVPWSSRAEFQANRQQDPLWIRRQRLLPGIDQGDYYSLVSDPARLRYALAYARVPYLDSCADCHAADGSGIDGLGSDLINGEWRRDADFSVIEEHTRAVAEGGHGRQAGSTAAVSDWRIPLTEHQIRALTVYIAKLSP